MADIIAADGPGISVVVRETFRGDAVPGDTLDIPFWEMGSWMGETVSPGEDHLLIPDLAGSLQVVGTPGRGYWLLRGFFDFNAFLVDPGVIDREELQLLCNGDTLPLRTVDVIIRFAGQSDFIGITFNERSSGWALESAFGPLDGLELDRWGLSLGGTDMYPYEPSVSVRIPLEDGSFLTLEGGITSREEQVYCCTVYPTGPVILNQRDLVSYVVEGLLPEAPVFEVQINGADPVELGLVPEPYMTTDDQGRLHLSGAEGMLDITSLFSLEYGTRPAVGFDVPMTCRDPLYFDFQSLPDGPSGHLATDIIDVLAKGVVTGSLSPNGDPEAPKFSLTIRRVDRGS